MFSRKLRVSWKTFCCNFCEVRWLFFVYWPSISLSIRIMRPQGLVASRGIWLPRKTAPRKKYAVDWHEYSRCIDGHTYLHTLHLGVDALRRNKPCFPIICYSYVYNRITYRMQAYDRNKSYVQPALRPGHWCDRPRFILTKQEHKQ